MHNLDAEAEDVSALSIVCSSDTFKYIGYGFSFTCLKMPCLMKSSVSRFPGMTSSSPRESGFAVRFLPAAG